MAAKQRIKSLSTRWLMPFKITIYILYTALFVIIIWVDIKQAQWFGASSKLLLYGYLLYRLLLMTRKIRQIEFDDDFLYVIQRNNDILIPLANIKSVDIKTMGGVYRVDLYYEDIVGDHFYFKPSLLYPLNFKKKDALVNLLRDKIDDAKKKRSSLPENALQS